MKEEKTIFTISLVLLLTLSAYFLADTVDAVIGRSLDAATQFTGPLGQERPLLEPRRELSDYTSILERGLFGEGKGPSGATSSEASAFRLIGTIEGEHFAGAVLEDASGVQNFYRIHEKMPDGSQIVKVQRDKITIRRPDGGAFDLQIIDDTRIVSVSKPGAGVTGGVRKLSEGKWAVDQREVASNTENLSQILTQARTLPYLENGKIVGFKINDIMPGSIFEKIGIQNGDVIQKINAQDMNDPGKFFQLYQGLKEEKNITVDLMRAGQRQTLNYEIR
jgi:general secretion pathway protein C